jgi:HlyD family secretion protein
MTFKHLPAVAFFALACGCAPTQPIQVKTADRGLVTTGVPQKLRRVIDQPASVEAFEETPLVARIAGYVAKVDADIGKVVKGPTYDAKGELTKPGTLLAELAVPEMLRELEQKQALVKQSRAEVDQALAALDAAAAQILTAQAQVREAEAAVARAEANFERWESEYVRFEKLVKDKVVDTQIRDEALNTYKAARATREESKAKVQSAQAQVKESEAKHNKAKADVAASKAHVLVKQAEEGRLQEMVDYRFIRAPFNGVVTRRNIHTGHFLQPNASGGPSVLFVVARTDKLRIIADIPEAEAKYITNHLEVKIQVPTMTDQTFRGKVARTSETLDAKSRTLRIEIDYVPEKNELRPGMFANVLFDLEFKDRYTLPASAIFTHVDRPCCWRVVDGKAVRTPLKLGGRDGQLVEVRQKQTDGATWENIDGKEEVVLTYLGTISEGKEVRAERK